MTWNDLFASEFGAPNPVTPHPMRFVCRFGKPLLLLPTEPSLATQALTLYPAQSSLGKTAKALLRVAILLRIPFFPPKTVLPVSRGSRFAHFIAHTAGLDSIPKFAVLAGNPETQGRRFVLLLFDGGGAPCAVVKVGMGPDACNLINHERAFFEAAFSGFKWPFIEPLIGSYQDGNMSAFAMPFIEGKTPAKNDWKGMESILRGWLLKGKPTPLNAIPSWQRLDAAIAGDARYGLLIRELEKHSILPAVFHGDFAPWNVRMTGPGQWTVLDWERGELTGVPGWDWFHWLIHVSMLVLRHSPEASANWIEQALREPAFDTYSREACIRGIEYHLLIAYLIYLHEFIVPKKNKQHIADLRDIMAAKHLFAKS